MTATTTAKARLNICVTCRASSTAASQNSDTPPAPAAERDGKVLYDALSHEMATRADPVAFEIVPVECLSNCKSGCSVALSAAGKWGYVYGNLSINDHSADILKLAEAYANSDDGIIPWRERPETVRRNVIARIPPIGN
ncbi:DUF1636 domain-containing protein [uncultured Thalassospira sp.]|jgi:predicted metal-binding protein|uniref:DUF1636 domain-containing protein n=1 Tax=uncultured Thalassospira sp. TaxID=404382 RepID=UPI0030D8804E|tara:strand:+ start:1622 stop:2038 length:417 start_codon:yes stop_codon:yes gene_type:complete